MKKIFKALCALCAALFICSCTSEKVFSKGNFSIVLDSSFSESQQVGYDCLYQSRMFIVGLVKTSAYSSISSAVSQIKSQFYSAYKINLTFVDYSDADVTMSYTVYENTVNSQDYFYLSSVYCYQSKVYLIDIQTFKINASDANTEKMLTWAKSVRFTELAA